ncbi:MAG: DUF3284 domain-containing protein [Eubacteriaceae bacterium]|jgi:hypothetical protein
MKIEKHLDITPEQFFEVVEKSVIRDMKKKKPVTEGLTYHKSIQTQMGGAAPVTITVTEYKPPSEGQESPYVYASTVDSNVNKTSISYHVTESEDGKCDVVYEETYHYYKTMYRWNYQIMSIFFTHSRKKQFIESLENIESTVKGNLPAKRNE